VAAKARAWPKVMVAASFFAAVCGVTALSENGSSNPFRDERWFLDALNFDGHCTGLIDGVSF
jgi:hypothetical protein